MHTPTPTLSSTNSSHFKHQSGSSLRALLDMAPKLKPQTKPHAILMKGKVLNISSFNQTSPEQIPIVEELCKLRCQVCIRKTREELLKHPLVQWLGNSLLKCSNHLAKVSADCTHYLLQIEVGITKRKRVMMVEGN